MVNLSQKNPLNQKTTTNKQQTTNNNNSNKKQQQKTQLTCLQKQKQNKKQFNNYG